jgi:dienelactone hydrolase
MRRPWTVVLTLVAVVAAAGLLAGCSTSPVTSVRPSTTFGDTPATNPYLTYSVAGPYAAGTFEYDVAGDEVVVWYPVEPAVAAGRSRYTYHLREWLPSVIRSLVPATFADGVPEDAYWGAPAAAGAFPVVLFSHGYGGYPEQSSFLTAHLATWGMIVVAADQQARDLAAVVSGTAKSIEPSEDVTEQLAALGYMQRVSKVPGSLLFGHVDAGKVATLGHSAGGGTAVLVAEADPAILGWIALAGVPVAVPKRAVPSLLVSGSLDKTVATSTVRGFYSSVTGNKALLVIDGYGHNVFDDICTINHAHGGVAGAAEALHLPVPPALLQLATDGCAAPDLYPPTAWPMIDQAVTAQLRFVLGMSTAPVGLGPGLDTAFAHVHAQFTGSAG